MDEPERFEDRVVGERPLGGGRVEQTILRLYQSSSRREMITRIVGFDASAEAPGDSPGGPGRAGPAETP